ncbi:Metallo-dependent hydrolase [Xylariaceae sp. AK1471]|nr:Metallo-dependent hydrolase [Xylariaceae sp. AK1471]
MELLESVVSDAREHMSALCDIELQDGYAQSIGLVEASPSKPPQLLLPPLCHPHVHLDKAYILTCNYPCSPQHPDYSDLCPDTGSFEEALTKTSCAKERYTPDDLYLRGSQLLATSYTQGVTSMRAFVELDHVTGTLPLTTAIRLKKDFAHLLELQICAFAQDPIFSAGHGDANRAIIESALTEFSHSVGAIGTTPYVEASKEASLSNIKWAITRALKHNLHLDFHLDYTLESPSSSPSQRPLTFSVIELLTEYNWVQIADKSKTIMLGHCTQLSILDNTKRRALADAIIASKLPIHFVGLPTSDIFMMGRPNTDSESSHNRPRGTIHVPSMIRELGLSVCLGINNVGNAFTPFGTGDPLQLASWAVGIYQAGTVKDAQLLYECVSTRARQAIGLGRDEHCGEIHQGQKLRGMLTLKNRRVVELPGVLGRPSMAIVSRTYLSLKDVVWDPPDIGLRSVVR